MFIIESKSGEVIGEAVNVEEALALMSTLEDAGKLLKVTDEEAPVLLAYRTGRSGDRRRERVKEYFAPQRRGISAT